MGKKTFFRIEYIAEKPKSKKDKEKTEVVVKDGMEEMIKFIKENGLSKDGKKLTDEEVADIIEKLDKDDVVELTDHEKELMASREGLAEINKKFSEDEVEDEMEKYGYFPEDKDKQVECLSCGAHNNLEDRACWYCQAELKQYNEEDISDELIQYTIYRRDGKVEHKWLTQKEYEEMWRQNDVARIKVEK